MKGYIRGWRLGIALLFVPRRLRDSTMRHWIAEMEKDLRKMQAEARRLEDSSPNWERDH